MDDSRNETGECRELSLTSINGTIASLLKEQALDDRVLKALGGDCNLLARESHLWDYKRLAEGSTHAQCELIKDVVSFHNSYGGYLILGVHMDHERGICACVGVDRQEIDETQLRALIKAYTGTRIDVAYRDIPVRLDASVVNLGLLLIPKREFSDTPVVFQKPAAPAPGGKIAFKIGDIYLRSGDESRRSIEGQDLAFLLGKRLVSGSIVDDARVSLPLDLDPPLQHNLPDKNLICAQFVGRQEILNSLWTWLTDHFSYVRVLAGDGGKGKTSIAYAFAMEFAMRRPGPFQQVMWLSAKRKQFQGLSNQYFDMPEWHYEHVDSLLRAIAERCGVTDEELADASTQVMKALCRDSLKILPALVVIDDVDSVEPQEQKRIMELATQLASSGSRFLLTTRANITYSDDICLTVPGLPADEYADFVRTLSARLKMQAYDRRDVDRLLAATGGSPLLTESIIRIARTGQSIAVAIDEWKDQAGRDARDAALDKEVKQLSQEARRALLCMAYLRECSFTELQQLTDYPKQKLSDAITELQSLFLVSAPVVTRDEPRFAVPEMIGFLAIEKKQSLAIDHRRLMDEAARLHRGTPARRSANSRMVGAAIGQAAAQLAQENVSGAIKTLEVALTRMPKQPEMQCFLARCYLKGTPARVNEARDLFKASHEAGNRRAEVYDGWFEAEMTAGHWPGAIAVTNLALEKNADQPDWRHRRAFARSQVAVARDRSGDKQGALRLLEEAADDLKVSIDGSWPVNRYERQAEAQALNDQLWLHTKAARRDSFHVVFRGIKRGDFRRVMYDRLFSSMDGQLNAIEMIVPDSKADLALRTMLQQVAEALAVRPDFKDDGFRKHYQTRLDQVDKKYRQKLKPSGKLGI